MKKTIIVILLFFITSKIGAEVAHIVDEIRAIVYHDSGAEAILTSDIRPSLDGSPLTLRDVVLEALILLDAKKFNVTVTESDVDRYLDSLQKVNNMSQTQLESVMADMGYSYQEGKQKLRNQQIVEQMLDYRIRSDKRFIIQREDVELYDQKNPQFKEATFYLAQVIVDPVCDFDSLDKDSLSWEEPFAVKESELADGMQFIVNQPVGSIVDRELVTEGLELTRLVKKEPARRVSVEERYDAIADILKRDRFALILKEYHNQLLTNASIRFTYPEDKIVVLGE